METNQISHTDDYTFSPNYNENQKSITNYSSNNTSKTIIDNTKKKRRANLSEEEREIANQKQQQYRSSFTDEKRLIYKAKNAEYQRQYYLKKKLSNPEWCDENRLKNNNYKRMKYAEMVAAEKILQKRSVVSTGIIDEEDSDDSEFGELNKLKTQDLQVLANKRQQLLEAQRNYKKTNTKWAPIVQSWDEQNPCR